jgi:DNA-binding SARP family transcriptional activator
VDFSVLGPLQVRVRGETVPVRRGLPRLLLTYLLLHPAEPVAASVLADRMWNGQLPVDPANAVHRVVSYVRHTLGGAGDTPLRTTSAGYVLAVPPAAVDSTRFAQLVKASGADATSSLPLLDEALSLGRHVDAVPQAQALVATYPLRESLRTSLMLALYRSGRQSEALAAAASLRRTLADELGIDPSPAVLALEQRILRQDPVLAAPTAVATPAIRTSAPQATAARPRSGPRQAAGRHPPVHASRPAPFPRAVTSLIGRPPAPRRLRPCRPARPSVRSQRPLKW